LAIGNHLYKIDIIYALSLFATAPKVTKNALPCHQHRALARQNAEDVPGPVGGLFCPAFAKASADMLDFSCFILFAKKKNEVGFGAKLPDEC